MTTELRFPQTGDAVSLFIARPMAKINLEVSNEPLAVCVNGFWFRRAGFAHSYELNAQWERLGTNE